MNAPRILEYSLADLADAAEEIGEDFGSFLEQEVSHMRKVGEKHGVIVGAPNLDGAHEPGVRILFSNYESYVNFWTDERMDFGGPAFEVKEMQSEYETLTLL